jgi:hypothetical protein
VLEFAAVVGEPCPKASKTEIEYCQIIQQSSITITIGCYSFNELQIILQTLMVVAVVGAMFIGGTAVEKVLFLLL